MKQKLKRIIAMLCICLTFIAGGLIEFKTNFVPEAVVVGQDIASSILKIVNRYIVLKENWLEKGLVYKSTLKEKIVLTSRHCIMPSLYSGGWRLTRII